MEVIMKNFLYGTRAKLGLIYPAPGWVMEPEYYAMSPEGVITCTTRISLHETNEEQLSKLGDEAVEAVDLLTQVPVDVIALGCTSGSFIGGTQYEQKLIERMEEKSQGIPCTTTSSAVIEALKFFGVKKISVATPYIEEVNQKARIFLEENGFEIVSFKGLGLLYDSEIDSQDLETVYQLTREVDSTDSEAIIILCTGIRSVPIIEMLEKDLEKPIISAIQATFWHSLRLSGIQEKIQGFGSLLERY